MKKLQPASVKKIMCLMVGRQVYSIKKDTLAHDVPHATPEDETSQVLCAQIDAKRSLPQSQKPKLRKLFVGGLAPETTEGVAAVCTAQ